MTKRARAKVTPATTDEELFAILRDLIEPLHDAHTAIRASSLHQKFTGARPGTLTITEEGLAQTIGIIESRYAAAPLRSWCNGHLRYGRLTAGPAYLRIDTFDGYTKERNFEDDRRALTEALQFIVEDANHAGALIVDVRWNDGGADPLGLEIASRFTDAPYVGFIKRARNDPRNPRSWNAPQPSVVRPFGGPRYRGPIVELIGPDTVSAGETFTMALMGRRPHVLRIGANTQGVYSDVLVRHLPNGWRFWLPNEAFTTESGTNFEVRGIPPDIAMPHFPASDLAAGRDSALERAIRELAASR